MGRRKIEIQPLTDDRNRTVTFVKRKAGLFKKAHELAVLCQVDIAVLIIGSNKRVYEFSSVDTNEIIKAYQHSPKIHEQKSPESYGSFSKKSQLGSNMATIDDDMDIGNDENDSDYDSEPDAKRQKRSYDTMVAQSAPTNDRPAINQIPSFNFQRTQNNTSNPIIEGASDLEKINETGRPVLRVQIPIDSKLEIDSAKTITALESNIHDKNGTKNSEIDENSRKSNINPPNISRYQSLGSFRSPDTRRPITTLPLPIHSKSSTSSPNSATAPQLPNGIPSFYGSMPQSGQYGGNSILPTPVLNQMFNQQYMMQQPRSRPQQQSQSQSQSQLSQSQGNTPTGEQSLGQEGGHNPDSNQPQAQRQNNIPQAGPTSGAANSQTGNEASSLRPPNGTGGSSGVSRVGGDNGPSTNPNTPSQFNQGKFRPPLFTAGSNVANTGAIVNAGEQTPVSGLPSRYVDMFPSPSNFYASQDWLNSGVTPMHSQMPHYFSSNAPMYSANRPPPSGGTGPPQNWSQSSKADVPSPVSYMAQYNQLGPNTSDQKKK